MPSRLRRAGRPLHDAARQCRNWCWRCTAAQLSVQLGARIIAGAGRARMAAITRTAIAAGRQPVRLVARVQAPGPGRDPAPAELRVRATGAAQAPLERVAHQAAPAEVATGAGRPPSPKRQPPMEAARGLAAAATRRAAAKPAQTPRARAAGAPAMAEDRHRPPIRARAPRAATAAAAARARAARRPGIARQLPRWPDPHLTHNPWMTLGKT